VRGANIGRGNNSPFRIVPERGKVTEHPVESSRNESWAVFNECEAGSYFANDAGHFVPHPAALAVESFPCPGDADVLAWEAARYHVNKASPRSSVKGANVIPNRERREHAVILSGEQYACWVGFPLDSADGSPSEQVAAEYSATSACEKCQLIHRFSLLMKSMVCLQRRTRGACICWQ
jgi:hypothetical protein